MKLSQEQIQQLYKFTKAHFVEHYDLQTELVDHLANGIEDQIRSHPQISFQEALDREFKKFGVFGFHDVVRDKTKVMEKRYWKILFHFLKDYFKLPKILMLMTFVAMVHILITLLPEEIKGYFIAVAFLSFMGIISVKAFRNRKRLKKKNTKWLLEDMILNHSNSLAFIKFCIADLYKSHYYEICGTVSFRGPDCFGIVSGVTIAFLYHGFYHSPKNGRAFNAKRTRNTKWVKFL